MTSAGHAEATRGGRFAVFNFAALGVWLAAVGVAWVLDAAGPGGYRWRDLIGGAGLTYFLGLWWYFFVKGILRKERAIRRLRSRPQLGAREFGERYFGAQPERAKLAAELRDVLAANLGFDLGGLLPADRLNEDLDAGIELNPDLFWEIQARFGAWTPVSHLEEFLRCIEPNRTFSDLVDYVERNRGRMTGD